MSRPRTTSSYSGQSYSGHRLGGIAETEYDVAAAFGEPALSDASSDEQMARAISDSKRSARSPVSRAYSYASSSSSGSTLLGSDSGSSRSSVSYAPSWASSQGYYPSAAVPRYGAVDATIARDLARDFDSASIQSELMRNPQYTRPAAPSQAYYSPAPPVGDETLARDLARSWDVASVQSDIISNTLAAARGPTPTPRYAADETIARNLARDWDVASVQSDLARSPQYARGPPLVVRSPSPSTLSIASASSSSSSSSQRTAYAYSYASFQAPTPTPSRPLSPLLMPTRLRTPSVRSMASNSSIRSAASGRSVSSASTRSTSSRASISSLLSHVTRSARHASLDEAAEVFRAAIPASSSLSRSSSSASFASARSPSHTSRAGSIRSTTSSRTARSSTSASVTAWSLEETESLKRLHALATAPVRCTNPGCGTMIRPAAFDSITFPSFIPHAPNNHNAPTDSMMPLPPTLLAALHARCPVCTTTHCRGCGMATACEGTCDASPSHPRSRSASAPLRTPASSSTALGRDTPAPSTSSPASGYNTIYAPPPCALPTHCPAARALGALAALLAFDRAAAVQSQGSPGRTTDKALLGPMHAVVWCIEGPSYPRRSHRGSRAGSVYGRNAYGGSDNGEDDEEPQEAHPALPPLVALSRLPGYVAALLQAGLRGRVDVGTWMARAPAYGAVLRVLRAVGDDARGCRRVLVRPVPVNVVGVEAWLRTASTRTPSTLPRDRHGAEAGDGETLLSLIRRLEPARLELLRLADGAQFGPTVETAHALCDGVMYLLLQDALGLLEVG